MVVIDSSVWINLLRGRETAAVMALNAAVRDRQALLADLVMLELLQGARSEREADRLSVWLHRFPIVGVLDRNLAVQCATNHRLLRSRGRTVRKTADLVIGTYCIVHGHALLQEDRDFVAMAEHLGLRLA